MNTIKLLLAPMRAILIFFQLLGNTELKVVNKLSCINDSFEWLAFISLLLKNCCERYFSIFLIPTLGSSYFQLSFNKNR
ncbi:MAG: hypothetical protein CLLPBCKN_007630 [Chroococcidiopsis cubana SAG 39.79]|nr:hypothetical protein [Chroococcidiopsis cubana SAG 39.79]